MDASLHLTAAEESPELGLREEERGPPPRGSLPEEAEGSPGPLAARGFVVGGVYANAQMFMRDCQPVIYESPGPSPIKAVPSMF